MASTVDGSLEETIVQYEAMTDERLELKRSSRTMQSAIHGILIMSIL